MMQIIARNVTGLGAAHVVKSLLDGFSHNNYFQGCDLYLPVSGPLSNYDNPHYNIIRSKSWVGNRILRVLECLLPLFFYKNLPSIVLGDLPLRGLRKQILLVHQPNLFYPRINQYASKSLIFRVSRFIFKLNSVFVCKFIVQTDCVAADLAKSYPKITNRISISPQPAPNWFNHGFEKVSGENEKYVLFYPAAAYPHKMHLFLKKLGKFFDSETSESFPFEVWVTLSNEEYAPYDSLEFVKNLGRLTPSQMNSTYGKVDALLFLSSLESYGLPLVEAMFLGLPILSVDLHYSRWLCGEYAHYFEPYSVDSFLIAIKKLIKSGYKGIKSIDYKSALLKFPNDWETVCKVFDESMTECLSR